jgi:putative membrane protein insertion efficiency factor
MIFLINFYRKYLSPLKSTRCPYYPTCSTYGLEAVQKYGAFKGGFLSFYRILRCNPLSRGGYDPVPEEFSFRNPKIRSRYRIENH